MVWGWGCPAPSCSGSLCTLWACSTRQIPAAGHRGRESTHGQHGSSRPSMLPSHGAVCSWPRSGEGIRLMKAPLQRPLQLWPRVPMLQSAWTANRPHNPLGSMRSLTDLGKQTLPGHSEGHLRVQVPRRHLLCCGGQRAPGRTRAMAHCLWRLSGGHHGYAVNFRLTLPGGWEVPSPHGFQ